MYIDYDEYHPYSGAISKYFETNIDYHIWCDHGYPYSTIKGNMLTWMNKESWEMTNKRFTEAKEVKRQPTTIV